LNSTSTIVGIIAGTTIGASVFVLALAAIYLRWNKLWIFKNDDDYYGGHVPLADQNSSLPSRQSSLPSVPESITTTKKSTQQAFDRPKGGSGSGSANSSEGRQRQSSKIRQTDEELGFRKQEDLTYHIHIYLYNPISLCNKHHRLKAFMERTWFKYQQVCTTPLLLKRMAIYIPLDVQITVILETQMNNQKLET
jgi:hypothetical protein